MRWYIICDFDLNFSINEWCWASFHVFISHLYVFLDRRNVCLGLLPTFWLGCLFFCCWAAHVSCSVMSRQEYWSGLPFPSLVRWVSCLYILEINSLSVVSFALIFSISEGCIFTLLTVSFFVQKLLSLIRSHCLFLFPLLWEVGQRGSCGHLCQRMYCLCVPLGTL